MQSSLIFLSPRGAPGGLQDPRSIGCGMGIPEGSRTWELALGFPSVHNHVDKPYTRVFPSDPPTTVANLSLYSPSSLDPIWTSRDGAVSNLCPGSTIADRTDRDGEILVVRDQNPPRAENGRISIGIPAGQKGDVCGTPGV